MPSYYANLKILGIECRTRLADATVYKKLSDDFDYDMMVNSWPASLSPGNELIDYWNSTSADVPGSRNLIGVKNKVVDELVKAIIQANDKETLVASVKALDRVLLWNYYVVPQWYLPYFRMLYWNKFQHPKVSAPYDGGYGLMTWWAK
jgi:microcin C transport system substrate-binding protein